NHSIAQCRGLLDLLLHRVCYATDGQRQVSESLEAGLAQLCESGSARLESASRRLWLSLA
ncbi:MAG TPA: hypothetical protein VKV04_20150, partial [Verrucomicrobiae bacterium]|nr:hypothetical protein [Verrucomicrobiae bacterium]